ncbi:unnamed protein product [Leptosia nina]|uniref:Peroxidase n=1 Tax=Leptosia nina TaxID=320188 RepID=A0AAV1J4R2_9NEOP
MGTVLLLNSFVGFFFICASVSGCLDGLECILDDVISEMCPILASTRSALKKVFSCSSDEEIGPFNTEMVSECIRCGRDIARTANKRGNQLVRNGVSLEAYSPSLHHFFTTEVSKDTQKTAQVSQELISATKLIRMKLCSSSQVTPNTFLAYLENNVIRPHELYCKPFSKKCLDDKYRTIDGTCNNKEHPGWGRRGAPFTRIAVPRYSDGIYGMPVAKSGRALPNPRLLSTRIFADRPIGSRVSTYLNMQWGQIVTHDIASQAMEYTDEGGIQCCLGNGQDMLPQDMLNDKCIPIAVPEGDVFYRQFGIKCLNFVRSITTPKDDCSLGYAEQMNTVTSYLDGSVVYGSDAKTATKLRTYSGGRLKEENKRQCKKGFLPTVDDKFATCDLRNISHPCYLTGDVRVNQTPTLVVLHTLLLREHNRVADKLSSMNPLWTDEKIYQEARKIVIAQIQHITYQEWLPLNFGEAYLRYYGISPRSLYSRSYSEDVNPGIISSFTSGAFRFLHTMIPDSIMACSSNYQAAYMYKLSDYYFNPNIVETSKDSFDNIVRGIVTQPSSEPDPFFSSEVTNLMFKGRDKWGLDLIAMDIQRGRDHGIASYNDYRETCGLRRATTFQDLIGEISQDRINTLAQLYECVDDIDLFVGGALEKDVQGSVLGHTFQCIIAEQFYRTRIGDRYFYDNGEMPHSFTPEQLKEIKKASIARLICDNTEGVKLIQRKAFEVESPCNPKLSCEDYENIPHVDLTAWKRPKFELYD